MTNKNEIYQLIENDGNTFKLLWQCKKTARKAGWTEDDIDKFIAEATSGDYTKLVNTVMELFGELNLLGE